MKKSIKVAIIIVSIIISASLFTSCLLILFLSQSNKNTEWMQKWKRIVVLDLKTEGNNEKSFFREFDTEWDWPLDNDPYEGHLIFIELDILYNGHMDNYVLIELSNDNEIIFSSKVNVFEPMEKKNDFTKRISGNIINYKVIGLFGRVELEFEKTYKIRTETFFDENLLEIRKMVLSIEKRVM